MEYAVSRERSSHGSDRTMKIRFSRYAALLIASIVIVASGSSARASSTDVFSALFSDLAAANFPGLAAAEDGIRALRDVRFESPDEMGAASAIFLVDEATILLAESTRDPSTGKLKGLAALGPGDTSIVIHELWHSYYWNVFRGSGTANQQFYDEEYPNRYASYPGSARETIQEEGYALFIQEVTRDYLQIGSILKNATPEQRQRLRVNPQFIRAYEGSFTLSIYGYYGGFGSQPVFSSIPISQADKDHILSFFFQSKITGHFSTDFPE
jgi:hypothetical protein